MDAKMIRVPDCAFQDGSYPCGYKDGGKEPECELCHKIRQASIREVVGWIEGEGDEICLSHCNPSRAECPECWQAQKEKWGIE